MAELPNSGPIGVYPGPERSALDAQPLPRDQMSDEYTEGSDESFTDKRRREHLESAAHISAESLARRHEVQGVHLRSIIWFAVSLLVAMTVLSVLLWWLLGRWVNQPLSLSWQLVPAQVTPVPAPGPGVDASAIADRPARIAPALEKLATYGWVDRQKGIVRIPIERAMDLLVQRGLKARSAVTVTLGTYPPANLDSSGGLASGGNRAP